MCGRFTLRTPASVLAEQFAVFDLPPFRPRYNIAPTQTVPVVRLADGSGPPRRRWSLLRWGLIPTWAKDPAIGNRLINARAETVAEKPAFRAAFRHRRCLLPADGFYEWRRQGKQKRPFLFHLPDDRPFAFAGLWESWQSADGSRLESCTLLTTEANELVRAVHDRMPVILHGDDYPLWLEPSAPPAGQFERLFRPYPPDEMVVREVGTLVNSPANEDPRCVEPVP